MDEMLTKAATMVTKNDTQISRRSNNNSIVSSTRTSPRVDPMTNRATMSFVQKRNDADAVSVFSQAIESVRGTKGKALVRMKPASSHTPSSLNSAAKSPARLAREKEPNFKQHDVIQKMYLKQVDNTDKRMMDKMQQQLVGTTEGKRLYPDKTNTSAGANMYPVLPSEEGGAELFHRRATNDFRDKSKDVYVAPPVSKTFELKNNFVHNQIANKNKVNVDHFKNIFNKKIFTDAKRHVI
jgi:hypothetical protein